MAGEINGTNTVITTASGEIVGQGETTLNHAANLIDISNKSRGDKVSYLEGEAGSEQLTFSTTIIYNNDDQYRAVRAAALAKANMALTLTYVGSGAVTDESFSGDFIPTGMSDAIPQGDKVSTTVTFNSNGDWTHVEAADV